MKNTVEIEGQKYLAPTWKEMGQMTVRLAQKIKKDNGKYDRLIALAKGGLGWARQLLDLLSVGELSSIQILFYEGILKTKRRPIVIQSLPISVAGEKVLVYDDVVDSGETVELAKNYLSAHGAETVQTASHFTKSWTKVEPDYSLEKTDAWILFPHDATENLKLLKSKWRNLKKEEFERRVRKLGLDPEIVDYYLASF
jgi:hypoxanthine phosphoribosyltransferase